MNAQTTVSELNYLPANVLNNDGVGALWNARKTWRVPTKTGRTGERHFMCFSQNVEPPVPPS